jgi:hypothetical protein
MYNEVTNKTLELFYQKIHFIFVKRIWFRIRLFSLQQLQAINFIRRAIIIRNSSTNHVVTNLVSCIIDYFYLPMQKLANNFLAFIISYLTCNHSKWYKASLISIAIKSLGGWFPVRILL